MSEIARGTPIDASRRFGLPSAIVGGAAVLAASATCVLPMAVGLPVSLAIAAAAAATLWWLAALRALPLAQYAVEHSRDAVFWVSSDARVIEVNGAACRSLGYTRDELVGLPVSEIDPAHTQEVFRERWLSLQSAGGGVFESVHRARSGREFPVEVNASFVDFRDRGYVCAFVRDIAEQKRTEEQHRKAVEAAEAANLAKSYFLANMSHEIRTPLTAILGYADLLADPDQSGEDRAHCIETIRRNGDHLLQIICDILDLSRIEAGRMPVERIECSPVWVVEEVASALRDSAERRGLELRIDYDGEIPETILNDPTRLRQILLNLVSNAIKFTESGHVSLAVRTAETSEGELRLEFEVTDTGVGMNPRELRRVFEPFSQADESTSRHYGGTGLGLTITRRLAELLGGQVRARSTPGQGSSFTVSVDPGSLEGVRMLAGPRTEARRPQPEQEQGRLRGRVLVAEDGADNQRLVRTLLERAGLEVDLAENGRLAVEMALAATERDAPYDLVLMDIQMPVMDGHEATRALRRAGFEGPILALTAHAMESDRQRCLDAGCDDVCTKPIDRRDLVRKLESYLCKGGED